MLLWFSGDEHALRACASAMAMRRTLRGVGRIRAGATDVVLRMSVGVHSGSYVIFLVGGSHRELLIGGPAATTVVAMEGSASAGQILISADTARRVPRSSVGASLGPGFLLSRSPATGASYLHDGDSRPPDEAVAECLPRIVRSHLLGGHATPEHRTASIAFLQLRTLDETIERHGAGTAAQQLDELVRLIQDAAGCARSPTRTYHCPSRRA